MQATWNHRVIAELDDTVEVEGNHYFPEVSVDQQNLVESDHAPVCV